MRGIPMRVQGVQWVVDALPAFSVGLKHIDMIWTGSRKGNIEEKARPSIF
jgi:hypothetical protein